jgi:hypothetical protein
VTISAVLDPIVSHAMSLALFERVNQHEPKNAPGNGLSCAVWVDRIFPAPAASGLACTSVMVLFNVRIYSSMLQEPQDMIDPNLIDAVDALMTAYSADFDLGGTVRNIDLLGQFGVALSALAGYLNQDNKMYRVMTIALPVVVNDIWPQSP